MILIVDAVKLVNICHVYVWYMVHKTYTAMHKPTQLIFNPHALYKNKNKSQNLLDPSQNIIVSHPTAHRTCIALAQNILLSSFIIHHQSRARNNVNDNMLMRKHVSLIVMTYNPKAFTFCIRYVVVNVISHIHTNELGIRNHESRMYDLCHRVLSVSCHVSKL